MFETLKKIPGKISRAAEEAAFDSPYSVPQEAWDDLFTAGKSPRERTVALFSFLKQTIPPEVLDRLTRGRLQFHQDILPVAPDAYNLDEVRLGKGSESNVYKLSSQDPTLPSLVVKLDRINTGESVDTLVERGKTLRQEHALYRDLYGEIENFIPDEHYCIAKSPRGGKRVLITLQEFLGNASELRDIFRGIDKHELLTFLQQDEHLQKDFRKFAEITLKRLDEEGEIIDTGGEKNVSLMDTPKGKRLIFFDPHLSFRLQDTDEKQKARLQQTVDFLREMLAALDTSHAELLRETL